MPPIKNHNTFMKRFKHPCCGSIFLTLEPNGHKASMPNLKTCKPKGMPMIVIISPTAPIRYSMEIANPPKTTQMMLPISFITSYSSGCCPS